MGAALVAASCAGPPPPVLAELPPFALTSHDGETVSLASLEGRAWVADFVFTRCGGTCPALMAQMRRLRARVPAETPFVSFTVDPEHDTVEVLARYARDHGVAGAWDLLTGPKAEIYALSVEGFKLAALEVPPEEQSGGDGPFLHSGKLVLVDGRGRVRGYYDGGEGAEMDRLARDLARVAREAP